MTFSIPNFMQQHNTIVQEIRNLTGLTVYFESDAAIRAAGEASVVDGLYSHQVYILRQLFIQTADEPYLYIHAEELGLPRLGGTYASGTVQAIANVEITIEAGTKITNGKGFYWSVTTSVTLKANISSVINVIADQVGASWNTNAESLLWVSPMAGLKGTVEVLSIGGGSDEEELEAWRARLLERKQLGASRDRKEDVNSALKEVSGIKHIYVYAKRRGLGSLDVAITAVGNPPTLPSKTLIDAAQEKLDEVAGFWADCRVYAPDEKLVDLSAVVSGGGVDLTEVEKTIRGYFTELEPAQTFQPAVIVSRIMALTNVTDVSLSIESNVVPIVNWMRTEWIRAGSITVRQP